MSPPGRTAASPTAPGPDPRPAAGLRWVLDPGDDVACIRALTALHDPEAGRVVCHPSPGATWSILVRDLLTALGKHRNALGRERRGRHGPRLLGVWLRAEQIRHLVVLRAHLLRPGLLDQLAALAAAAGATVWPVWHRHGRPPTTQPVLHWTSAAAALAAGHRPATRVRDIYPAALAAARAEARAWRPVERLPRWQVPYWQHTRPGCELAAVLQRLTIDAATPAELLLRLRASQAGFAAEGWNLALPEPEPAAVAVLGPRLAPDTVARLRQLICPVTAAAVMLALATDAEARFLARHHQRDLRLDRLELLAGTYRIPPRARPLLRAAVIANQDHPDALFLLTTPGHALLMPQRLAHLIRRGANLAGVRVPPAARPLYGTNPATPFAASFTTAADTAAIH